MKTHHVPLIKHSESGKSFQRKVSQFTSLISGLQSSEYDLIVYMKANHLWLGDVPEKPVNYSKGNPIDYGIYLYWLNTPSAVKAITNEDLNWVILAFLIIINLCGVQLPKTSMTDENYRVLRGTRLIYIDGSVISTEPFGLYDPNWLRTLINLAMTILFNANYNDCVLPSPPSSYTPMKLIGNKPGEVSLGLLSDWGAGTAVAMDVMNELIELQPDYLIHLGDIYYSGSPSADKQLSFNYDHLDDVQNNFLALWPTETYSGKSFTMNGNHEMYCGANGLFNDALAHPAFSSQLGVTYFALQAGDWTVLCLDSAYYAYDEDLLHMFGCIAGKEADAQAQISWIKSLHLNPEKVIVMTHHNAFDTNLLPDYQRESLDQPIPYYQRFWDSIQKALGGDPYAWYWGHVHNAIVYKSPVTIFSNDDNGGKPLFTTNTFCRCIGHGAMPYGATDTLKSGGDSPYSWCAQYVGSFPPGELPNGYVMLNFSFGTQNVVNQITESYYLINKPLEPAFTSILFARSTQIQ